MGYFDDYEKDIEDAKRPLTKRFNAKGTFTFAVMLTKMQPPRKPGGGDSFVVELLTLSTTAPEQEVGARTSWVSKMAWDGTLGDMKSFAAGVTGARFEDIKKPHLNAMVEVKRDENGVPLKDGKNTIPLNKLYKRLVRCRVYETVNPENGKVFTKHEWSVVPAADVKKMEQIRDELLREASA